MTYLFDVDWVIDFLGRKADALDLIPRQKTPD